MHKQQGFRSILHAWIAGTSLAAFVGGWILLGHSDKPAPLAIPVVVPQGGPGGVGSEAAPLPTLAPLPEIQGGSSLQVRPLPQQNFNFSTPRLRTRGS